MISWVVAGFEMGGSFEQYGVVKVRLSCRVSANVVLEIGGRAYIFALGIVIRCGYCSGCSICICGFIVDGCQSMWRLIVLGTITADIRTHPIGRVGLSDTFDNDVTALTNPEGYDVCSIRLDWHKIVGHYGHVVTVNSKALNSFSTAVDKS